MDKPAAAQTRSEDDTAKDEAALDRYIEEMERICQQLAKDQKEIESLRAETRAVLAQLKAA